MFRRFSYNNSIIYPSSIYAFETWLQKKLNNDILNKTRENIVGAVINKKVPPEYYIIPSWSNIKTSIYKYIHVLHNKEKEPYFDIQCVHKGGRRTPYDFLFRFIDENGNIVREVKVELKYNASSIDDAPQFVSPAKPSKFMININTVNVSYEEYFYIYYLPILSQAAGLPMPTKEEYISTINSNNPSCMEAYKSLYKTDMTFNILANEQSRLSIRSYMEKSELDIASLSNYLSKTQKDKHYMLYNSEKNEFTLETVCMDNYKIKTVSTHPEKYRYECKSENGKEINVLLRWKNGNGIAFPAFQISSKKEDILVEAEADA